MNPLELGNRFLLTKRLGKGGAANVYLAFDPSFNVWRAAKVMHVVHASDPEMRERFAREARVMARLDSRYVVKVIDTALEADIPYIVMELMSGGCVLDWMRIHGAVPARWAVQLTVELLKALNQVHKLGVVHRDVKPHNMLLASDGSCKLTDFGIAKVETEATVDSAAMERLTQVGTVMGTTAFMSPEQRNDASSVDTRTDIYSAGATLYTMIAKKAKPDLFMAKADEPLFKEVPDALIEVILTACRYSPAKRYANTAAFISALEEVVDLLPEVPDGVAPLAEPQEMPSGIPDAVDPSDLDGLSDLVTALGRPAPAPTPAPPVPIEHIHIPPPEPLYVEEAPPEPEPTPEPESTPEPASPPETPEEAESLMVPTLVGVGVLLLLLIGGVGLSAEAGRSSMESAAAMTESAGGLLVSSVHSNEGVNKLLGQSGADLVQLGSSRQQVISTKGEDQVEAAIAYVTLLESQYRIVKAKRGEVPELQRAARVVDDLVSSRSDLLAAREGEAAAAESFAGKLATMFGRAP